MRRCYSELGPVTVTVESTSGKPDFVWMAHREPEFGGKRDDRKQIAEALRNQFGGHFATNLPIQIVSTGVPFIFVPIRTLDALAKCAPNASALAGLFKPGEQILPVYMFVANQSGEFAPRSRMFAPHDGVARGPRRPAARRLRSARIAATYGLIDPAPKASFLINQGRRDGTAE